MCETSFTLNTISSSHSLFLLFNFAKAIGGAGLKSCEKRKVLLAMHFIFFIKVIKKTSVILRRDYIKIVLWIQSSCKDGSKRKTSMLTASEGEEERRSWREVGLMGIKKWCKNRAGRSQTEREPKRTTTSVQHKQNSTEWSENPPASQCVMKKIWAGGVDSGNEKRRTDGVQYEDPGD